MRNIHQEDVDDNKVKKPKQKAYVFDNPCMCKYGISNTFVLVIKLVFHSAQHHFVCKFIFKTGIKVISI